jgi:hypothetical protein
MSWADLERVVVELNARVKGGGALTRAEEALLDEYRCELVRAQRTEPVTLDGVPEREPHSDLVKTLYLALRLEGALENHDAAASPPERLVFDDHTHTVTLDGKEYHIANPKAYAVYKAIVQRADATITKRDIRGKVQGVAGKRTVPSLLKTLPPALRKTIRCGPTGYCHVLRTDREKMR